MIRTLTAALFAASLVLACGGATPDHEVVPDYPTILLGQSCQQDTGFLVDVADSGSWSVVWIDCGERVEEMTIGVQVRIVAAVMDMRSRDRQLEIDAFKGNGRKE